MSSFLRFRALFVALTVIIGFAAPLDASQASASVGKPIDVLVQKSGTGNVAEKAVSAAGGKVTFDLPIVNGFAAQVPAGAVARLQNAPGVSFLTADRTVHVQSNPADGASKQEPASVFKREIGASDLNSQGINGQGSTVALIDTGVSDVADLRGRIVPVANGLLGTKPCLDLSGESSCNDSYGHGTFIAGLIAGTGSASDGLHTGVAPGAKILSIKIAGKDGSAPVGKILYAIQWVVSHKAEYGIDVLNLSLGTDSTNSYKHDPLNQAVEKAWNSGISVVVSAGNRGPGNGTISKPADDPLVITTGAVDDHGTPSVKDDLFPNFSSRGPTVGDGLTKPDVVAPGARVISLRSPNSSIEKEFPGGGVNGTYRRASGTSMAAGVTSGAIALLNQAHPDWSPNQIKHALTTTAVSVASDSRNDVGSGLINVKAASALVRPGESNQGVVTSDGTDPIADSQGTVNVTALTGEVVSGTEDLLSGVGGLLTGSDPVDPSNPNGGSWYATQWQGGSWYGGSWYGGSWYGGSWYGGSWYGGSWYGAWS